MQCEGYIIESVSYYIVDNKEEIITAVTELSSGHVVCGHTTQRGVMRRACDELALPVVACLLLLACASVVAGSEQLAPGNHQWRTVKYRKK